MRHVIDRRPGHFSRVAAAMVLWAVVLFTMLGAGSTPQEVRLQGVPPEGLRDGGISLEVADTAGKSIVTAESARPAAGFQDATVKQIALVRVRDTHQVPPVDRIAWAFDFDPAGITFPGGPVGSTAKSASYAVAFVDGETGAFLFGYAGGTGAAP